MSTPSWSGSGGENLDEIAATVQRYGIDCGFERTGELAVVTRAHELADLDASGRRRARRAGHPWRGRLPHVLRRHLGSGRHSVARPGPARVGIGRAPPRPRGCESSRTPRSDVFAAAATSWRSTTGQGTLSARQVALATNAFAPLLTRLRFHTVPVWDYVLMTEPLTAAQLDAIGWQHRQGISDSGNQFHYYRLTDDNRILWGGYDAIYHFGRRIKPSYAHRDATYQVLASHFFTTFPQLTGLRFSHRWGGVIDTCTRFCAFFGTAHRGRVAYATGYTGPWRGRVPVRRQRHARPARGPTHRAHPAPDGAHPAAAVPARALRLDRHHDHDLVAQARRPDRSTQSVAPRPRPLRPGLRLLTGRWRGVS